MNPKLKTFIDSKYGHLLFLGIALFAGAFAQNLKALIAITSAAVGGLAGWALHDIFSRKKR